MKRWRANAAHLTDEQMDSQRPNAILWLSSKQVTAPSLEAASSDSRPGDHPAHTNFQVRCTTKGDPSEHTNPERMRQWIPRSPER